MEVLSKYDRFFAKFSRTRYIPLVAVEARNALVRDITGRVFIDFSSSAAVMSVGYANPAVVKAVAEQVEKLTHFTHIYGYNLPALELAERLAELAPVENPKIYLGLSGSDAVEAALLAAKAYRKGANILLAYENSFHGCTLASATASGIELSRESVKLVNGWSVVVKHLPYPDCYRCPVGLEPHSCKLECTELLKALVEEKGDQIFAYIAEPVQGDGGIIMPPREYFSEVTRFLRKHGIPVILDEVQTGLGRTGYWFACEYYGVKPDLIVLGKALGGGLPVSATVGREEVMESLPEFSYSFTLSGNPVACSAALATIKYIEENKLVERSRRLGEAALKRLREMMEKHPLIGDVRGLGLMIGVDLVSDKLKKTRATVEAKKVVWRAYELGLLIFYLKGNVLRVQPPLTIEEELLMQGLDILEKAIDDVEKSRVGGEAMDFVKGW